MAEIKVVPARDGGFVVYERSAANFQMNLGEVVVFAGSRSEAMGWLDRWMVSERNVSRASSEESAGPYVQKGFFRRETPDSGKAV